MKIINKNSKKAESVDLNDVLYTYYETESDGTENRQTWTFPCCGLIKSLGEIYIVGPGGHLYSLGVNCFTNLADCWAMIRKKNKPECGDMYKIVFTKVLPEEKVTI